MRFLSVKSVPKLSWSAPKALTIKPPLVSVLFLIIGLIIFGLGEALLVAAGVGVSPWVVFSEGVSNITGWSIGFATFIISISVLTCWIPLKQVPGIGTILNAIIIAFVLDHALPYLPIFENYALKILEALLGILLVGFGGAIYLIANLGPGPRDGLMTGLQAKTNLPIAWVRTAIEITVIAIGWSLGGTVGIGTILFAFGIGAATAAGMYFLQSVFTDSTFD